MFEYAIHAQGENITITPMNGDSIELHGADEVLTFINRISTLYLEESKSQSCQIEEVSLSGETVNAF